MRNERGVASDFFLLVLEENAELAGAVSGDDGLPAVGELGDVGDVAVELVVDVGLEGGDLAEGAANLEAGAAGEASTAGAVGLEGDVDLLAGDDDGGVEAG
eukprot:137389_1